MRGQCDHFVRSRRWGSLASMDSEDVGGQVLGLGALGYTKRHELGELAAMCRSEGIHTSFGNGCVQSKETYELNIPMVRGS